MGLLPRSLGILQKPPGSMSATQWCNALCDEWFNTQTGFVCHVMTAPIAPDGSHATYTPLLRAVMIFMRFGLLTVLQKCPVCHRKAMLVERTRPDSAHATFEWTCPVAKNHHFNEAIAPKGGILSKIDQSNWPAFLNFISLLRLQSLPLHAIHAEVIKAHGMSDSSARKTMCRWRHIYQEKLKQANIKKGYLKIGSPNEWVVMDETCVGIHEHDGFTSSAPKGISKFAPAVRTTTRRRAAVRKRILKRLPGRTIWRKPDASISPPPAAMKRPAAVPPPAAMKRPAAVTKKPAAVLKRPAGKRDARANGKWLWAAVTVGKGKDVYTHGNGKKKFTFCFLPKRSEASHNKPRGLVEIKKTIQNHVVKGSNLIFDSWKSTVSAAKQLGFKSAPPVNHSIEFRNRTTGFHSNDIESENSRLKHMSRVRNGRLMLNELDLHEYAFYINRGKSMACVLKALAL